MKVTCNCCGRQFEYGETNRQCPKCASYYKLEEEVPNPNIQKSGSASKRANVKKRSKGYYVLTAVLVLIIILFGSVSFITAYLENKTNYDKMAEASIVKPKELALGETFLYSSENYEFNTASDHQAQYAVTIMGAHIDTDERLMVPEGYEMVVVEYQVTNQGQQGDVTGVGTAENSLDAFYAVEIKPYLITAGEQYIEVFPEVKIKRMKGEEGALYATDDFYQYRGELYFLVKQKDAKGLWLNCMEPGEYADILKESYIIRDLEVK